MWYVTTPINVLQSVVFNLNSGEYVDDMGHFTTNNDGRIIIAVTNKGNLICMGL